MTRRFPWADVLGWTALALAALGAGGVAFAASYAMQGARNPQSFGDLAAVVLLMCSVVPSLLALPVAIVQSRRKWGPTWRTRTTAALACVAPASIAVLALGSVFA
ncbi:hypothetical protein [Cellulomonas humilata]|uniref:hypothetical protein n=1 Tax=Cellulomonas humilata TaxID=144055 RepID=UPI001B35786E|nr:hypothetical protein [Cellulomonas humilata]